MTDQYNNAKMCIDHLEIIYSFLIFILVLVTFLKREGETTV